MNDGLEAFPCGCRHGTTTLPNGERAFVIKPCKMTCENYVYAQRESQRQGKPIRFQDSTKWVRP